MAELNVQRVSDTRGIKRVCTHYRSTFERIMHCRGLLWDRRYVPGLASGRSSATKASLQAGLVFVSSALQLFSSARMHADRADNKLEHGKMT